MHPKFARNKRSALTPLASDDDVIDVMEACMNYVIEGLDPRQFAPLFACDAASLRAQSVVEVIADDDDYPCRISLAGAAKGDRLLLVNYAHLPAASPYRSAHAIYIAQGSREKAIYRNRIPPVMTSRMLSIRAFDANDMMVDADLIDGSEAEKLIRHQLANPATAYLHVHFAKRGCFAARVHMDAARQ
jgi:hypothetical protein